MAMSPSSSTPAGASSSAPENLTDPSTTSSRTTSAYNLRSVRAYLLKESLDAFWQYDSALWPAGSSTSGVPAPCAPDWSR